MSRSNRALLRCRRGPGVVDRRVQREVKLAVRAYELMVILDGDLEDEAVQPVLDRVGEQVEASAGRVASVDVWGKRRFAYEIDHKWEGIYAVLEIVSEAPSLEDLERMLHLADELVRHKLIRLPDGETARRGLLGEAAPAEAG